MWKRTLGGNNNNRIFLLLSGIIDGTGSIGAAVGQVILPYIQASAGWKWVFYSFMIEVYFASRYSIFEVTVRYQIDVASFIE